MWDNLTLVTNGNEQLRSESNEPWKMSHMSFLIFTYQDVKRCKTYAANCWG